MDFRDIKDKQKLVGMYVLYERGTSYGGTTKSIKRITKVTKTGFRITPNKNANGESYDVGLFDIERGYQKGNTGRSNMGNISRCDLISEEEGKALAAEWKRKRESKEMGEKIGAKLGTLPYEKLSKILELIGE